MTKSDPARAASRRGRELQAHTPRATRAYFDRKSGRVVIHFSSNLIISFAPSDAQGLEDAAPADLASIEISPSGFGIHFPKLDADLYVPALLEGFLCSERWMAGRLGRIGGRSRSAAKRAAARENGKLGGRPVKEARKAAERRGRA